MKATYIKYSETNSFSPTIIAYLAHDPLLKPFITDFPSIEAFGRLIADKTAFPHRELLYSVLIRQYRSLNEPASPQVMAHIDLLKLENTFTVTTGHQLNLFTGPLYFIFKIITAINLAKELKATYPGKNFVPVYWMASEDHDFAEINHTYIRGTKISWNTTASGATGRLETSDIGETLKQYQKVLGLSEHAEKLFDLMEKAYLHHHSLADATRFLVNALFKEYGLVILDASEPELKRAFAPIVEQDILEENSFREIQQSSKALEEAGFSTQVNAREINFFYMQDKLRERIVRNGETFQVLNTDISFSKEELSQHIQAYPERFSPNVVMRPLYQEIILPNVAYVGGGAEVVYWLQLKRNFDYYGLHFPLLLLRNSALIAREGFHQKLDRLKLNSTDIFKPLELLKKDWVRNHSEHTLTLSQETCEMDAIFEKIGKQAAEIDRTLIASTEAAKARFKRAIQNLEKKMLKAEKRNYSEVLQQLEQIKNAYFPDGILQERVENVAQFYLQFGDEFIAELIRHFRPLEDTFTILEP